MLIWQVPVVPDHVLALRARIKEIAEHLNALGRVTVKGDGYCWIYAFLGSLQYLTNPRSPTKQDYAVCTVVMKAAQQLVKERGGHPYWSAEHKRFVQERMDSLKYPPPAVLDEDNYGGGAFWFIVTCVWSRVYDVRVRGGARAPPRMLFIRY